MLCEYEQNLFSSLFQRGACLFGEAILFYKQECYSWNHYLRDIIQHNVRYRDCIRDEGIDVPLAKNVAEV